MASRFSSDCPGAQNMSICYFINSLILIKIEIVFYFLLLS
nr:MAG TPA: hypothetical protein [Caudoviricetes sp.]